MQRRTRKLIEPRRQISLVLYIYMGLTAAFAGAVFMYLRAIATDVESLQASFGVPLSAMTAANSMIMQAMIVTATAGLILFFLTILISAALQGRVFGTEVPIRRLLGQLLNGEYGAKGGLRKHDEFKGVMSDLNALSAKLAERHGSSTKNG